MLVTSVRRQRWCWFWCGGGGSDHYQYHHHHRYPFRFHVYWCSTSVAILVWFPLLAPESLNGEDVQVVPSSLALWTAELMSRTLPRPSQGKSEAQADFCPKMALVPWSARLTRMVQLSVGIRACCVRVPCFHDSGFFLLGSAP